MNDLGGIVVEYRCPRDHANLHPADHVVTLIEDGRGWTFTLTVRCQTCCDKAVLHIVWWESDILVSRTVEAFLASVREQ